MGWSPFDVRILKFEIEQWLNACDIDSAVHPPFCALSLRFMQNTLQRAFVRSQVGKFKKTARREYANTCLYILRNWHGPARDFIGSTVSHLEINIWHYRISPTPVPPSKMKNQGGWKRNRT